LLKTGDVFLTYLIIYPVGRFFLEFLRLDPSNVGALNANQTLMAVTASLALAVLVLRHRFGKPETREETTPVQAPGDPTAEVSVPAASDARE
jgi:phosphatidylglycerol:prolipoprotein diacylglycerol transferase